MIVIRVRAGRGACAVIIVISVLSAQATLPPGSPRCAIVTYCCSIFFIQCALNWFREVESVLHYGHKWNTLYNR